MSQPSPPPSAPAFRSLMDRVEGVVRSIDRSDHGDPTVERLAAAVTEALGHEMGFSGGRIYLWHDDGFGLWRSFGAAQEVERGTTVPFDYEPVQIALAQGACYFPEGSAAVDPEIEARLGTSSFAAIVLGSESNYLLAFDLMEEHHKETVLFSLELLRHFLDGSIKKDRVEDILREARRIQSSILPQKQPVFGNYDIAGRLDPLESVGGDFYDCIPISDKILGLAMADVSGHGLPAAMQVRDIYMGLRMGTGRDFKIVRTIERLNQIVNLSSLTGRFVSLFYGELETSGTFIYCNAGHPPPLHVRASGEVSLLDKGGVVLGPLPNAIYTRGYLTMEPGDLVVFYTDGIVETLRECSDPEVLDEYGAKRLEELIVKNRHRDSLAIVDAVFADVEAFCDGAAAGDDRTVAVVKKNSD